MSPNPSRFPAKNILLVLLFVLAVGMGVTALLGFTRADDYAAQLETIRETNARLESEAAADRAAKVAAEEEMNAALTRCAEAEAAVARASAPTPTRPSVASAATKVVSTRRAVNVAVPVTATVA